MAYFHRESGQEEKEYTRRFDLPEQEEEPDYDDGFDELTEDDDPEETEELTDEEKNEIRENRSRLLFEIGDLGGTIIGTVVILLLIALLLSIVNFLRRDLSQNMVLLKTKW